MVKSDYTRLQDLNEHSKDIKIKTRVISKENPKETASKRRYQKLLLKDDEGTTMSAAIFGEDIETLEHAIMKNGEYEFSNIRVKVAPRFLHPRTSGEYQIDFNSDVRITPLDLSACAFGIQYRSLDKIRIGETSQDDLIDTMVIVIYVGEIQNIKANITEEKFCHIIVADQSCVIRPVKISLMNTLAIENLNIYQTWPAAFAAVGFCGLHPITCRGVSFKSGVSTRIVESPAGDMAEALRLWANEHEQMLEDWRGKAMQLYGQTENKVPQPLSDLARKKARTIWPDDKYWIRVKMSTLEPRNIHIYIGCNKCGKACKENLGAIFVCNSCSEWEAIAVERALLIVYIFDTSGFLKVSAFANEVERMLGLKLPSIHALMMDVDSDPLETELLLLQKKEMLLQISPANVLFTKDVLKWVVREVEDPPQDE